MRKRNIILPIATALASLLGVSAAQDTAHATAPPSEAKVSPSPASTPADARAVPNSFFAFGNELLGFIVTEQPDGTVIATHYSHTSHSSHSSHSSHQSHYSGR